MIFNRWIRGVAKGVIISATIIKNAANFDSSLKLIWVLNREETYLSYLLVFKLDHLELMLHLIFKFD